MTSTTPKQIVIIGGSYTGIAAAKALLSKVNPNQAEVTVIERNDFMFHPIASLRGMVDSTFDVSSLFIPYTTVFRNKPHGKVIKGTVTKLEKNKVTYTTSSETDVVKKFDFCIVATGSSYPFPIKVQEENRTWTKDELIAEFKSIQEKVKEASSCLVVGGGVVGIEMAGELAALKKQVTVLDSNSTLLSREASALPDKFKTKLESKLAELDVKLVLGDRIVEEDGGRMEAHNYSSKTVKTNAGVEITTDVQFLCAGTKPNSKLVEEFDVACIDTDQQSSVRVNANLSLKGCSFVNIYAVGDVCNHPTPKLAYWGAAQATFLAQQLASKVKNDSYIVKDYDYGGVGAMIIPLGPKGGVSVLPIPVIGQVVLGDFATKMIKAKDLMVQRFWSELNAKQHSS